MGAGRDQRSLIFLEFSNTVTGNWTLVLWRSWIILNLIAVSQVPISHDFIPWIEPKYSAIWKKIFKSLICLRIITFEYFFALNLFPSFICLFISVTLLLPVEHLGFILSFEDKSSQLLVPAVSYAFCLLPMLTHHVELLALGNWNPNFSYKLHKLPCSSYFITAREK